MVECDCGGKVKGKPLSREVLGFYSKHLHCKRDVENESKFHIKWI